jgi:hypothetical protein
MGRLVFADDGGRKFHGPVNPTARAGTP